MQTIVTIKNSESENGDYNLSIEVGNINSHEIQFIETALDDFYKKEVAADAKIDKNKYGSALFRLDYLKALRDKIREQLITNVEPLLTFTD